MVCRECGKYYPDDEKRCPWCNHVVNPADKRKIKSVEFLRVEEKRGRSEASALIRSLIAYQFGGRYSSNLSLVNSVTKVVRRDAVFRVEYVDGRVAIENAKVDGLRYMKLMSLAR